MADSIAFSVGKFKTAEFSCFTVDGRYRPPGYFLSVEGVVFCGICGLRSFALSGVLPFIDFRFARFVFTTVVRTLLVRKPGLQEIELWQLW